MAGGQGQPNWEQARLMEHFWFDSDAQWAPIGTLSGGERRRLQLLLVLAGSPNVVLLDEPSNDLDLDTLRALEDHLEAWPGTVVVASHDRAFLERTVEDALVLDGEGGATMAPGGYAGYLACRSSTASRGPVRSMTGRERATTPAPAGKAAAVATDERPAPARPRSPATLSRLLRLAEREMDEAAAVRDRLAGELAAGTADHTALGQLAHALAQAEALLAEAEERWLTLAEELGR